MKRILLQIRSSQRGFTLIELLVVLFIISMISGISIANFRAAEKQKRAVIALDTVINAIRNAQNFTLTGKGTNNANTACRVPQYYRVSFFYTTSISLYAHNNCGSDDLIETYTLPVNTQVKASRLLLNGTPATNSLSIVFTPPFAAMTAAVDGGIFAVFTSVTVTVETTDGTVSKDALVDGISGRIGQ